METYKYDVVILGAGSAGLAAAYAVGRYSSKKIKIALIEKELKPGKKLLATGNGRCNLTNINMSSAYYNETAREFLDKLIERMNPQKLIDEFSSMGLLCRIDSEGRVYPYSNRATTVLDIFSLWIKKNGADVFCGTKANEVTAIGGGYKINCGDKMFIAKKLILSTGGAVQPNLGSDGSSYRFAKQIGLKCSNIFPSLVPISVSDKNIKILKGVRAKARVKLKADGKIIAEEYGEVQFNEKNISGICIFQLSRYVNEWFVNKTISGTRFNDILIEIDLIPEYSHNDILQIIDNRIKLFPGILAKEMTNGVVHEKLGEYITKKIGIRPETKLSEITSKEKHMTADMLKSLTFKPTSPSDLNAAQVTAGGIAIDEIDGTFQSKKYPGLYIIGEALDVDGKCGGYNLHFAFSSAITASRCLTNDKSSAPTLNYSERH